MWSGKNKNILFIESGSLFGYSAFIQQFLMEAKAIKEKDLRIVVVAYESLRDIVMRKSHMYREMLQKSGITYLIIPSWFRRNIVIESIRTLINTIILGLLFLFTRPDIIHAHDPTSAYYAVRLKKMFRVKVIFDMHGIGIEEGIYSKQLKENSSWHKRLTRTERYIAKNADFIFCVSGKMRDYIASKYGISESKFVITPTSVDTKLFSYSEDKKKGARNRLVLNDKFVVIFMGHVKSWQINDILVRFFRALKEKIRNVHFLILTDGAKVFEDVFKRSSIDADSYSIYSVKHEEVSNYAMAGDIGILLREDSIVNWVAAPAKFGEYLALGLPVVVTKGIGDTEDIIKKHKVGVILEGTDEDHINRCIAEISALFSGGHPELSESCSQVANMVLSKDISITTFMRVYEKC